MADFGKLNFSVSFNPTSAFPLDARCYFDSLALAKAAAATAQAVGSTDTVYYVGQRFLVVENDTPTWYTIQADKTLLADGTGSGGTSFTTDDTLSLESGVLSVNTTDAVEENNTNPITSKGVYAYIKSTVGTIEESLSDI